MFMIIDGVFKSQPEQVEEYQNLLKSKIKRDTNGGTVSLFEFLVECLH
jgi:phosphorylase kinase alpha/beta subunit